MCPRRELSCGVVYAKRTVVINKVARGIAYEGVRDVH